MIVGIGMDIVQIGRMESWIHQPGLLRKYFHPEELKELHELGKFNSMSLAARYAAKEAFGKALGTGLAGLKLADIMVVTDRGTGRPRLLLSGTAESALLQRGGGPVFISLTHEKEYAGAVVVIEGGD